MKTTVTFAILLIGVSAPLQGAETKKPELNERQKAQTDQFLKSDKDGDERLSVDETSGLMARFFQRNDTNEDGYLDRRELTDLSIRLSKRRQQRRPDKPGRNQTFAKVPEGVELRTDVPYREGNPKWMLDLALPKAKSDTLRPGLVIVHGGGWRSGDKGGGQWRSLPLEYAATGYICISVNYRLTDEAPFPACVEDVKCAVRWLRAHAEEFQLDPKRIGAYGNSAGAHLVSMLGLVGPEAGLEGDGPHQGQSSQMQAVCASATPTDFTNWRIPGLLAGPEESLAERAAKASPISHVSEKAPPFLLVHGTADRTVKYEQGKVLADLLKKAGTDVTLMTFEGAGHGVFDQHSAETKPAMEAFFAKHLKK